MSAFLIIMLMGLSHVLGGISYGITVGKMAVLPGMMVSSAFLYLPCILAAVVFGT